MRSETEIRQKLEKLIADKRRELQDEFLSRKPRNCVFNTRFRLRDQGMVGFCQNPTVFARMKTKVFVCNEEETAQTCECYDCRNTVESVEDRFREILKSPALCGEKFPKVAVLLWVIQRSSPGTRRERFSGYFRDLIVILRVLISGKWW